MPAGSSASGLGTGANRPLATYSPPTWLIDAVYVAGAADNDPLLVCVEGDPDDADVVVVKVTNNRGHGLLVQLPTDPSGYGVLEAGGSQAASRPGQRMRIRRRLAAGTPQWRTADVRRPASP